MRQLEIKVVDIVDARCNHEGKVTVWAAVIFSGKKDEGLRNGVKASCGLCVDKNDTLLE